ncbi:MAG: DedA family protein [Bacteroidales bacterium]|nr:DedA family protein [Bacteroidales bacterium]
MKKFILLVVLIAFGTASKAQTAESGYLSAQEVESEITTADSHYHGWVAKVVQWYGHNVNYTAVGALMTLESSFIPFPSEIVIPPAVMVAADPDTPNDMKVWLIVLIGTLGALLGAYINYFLSRWLGRPIIYKFVDSKIGHALSLSGEKMERAERYFNDHGVVSTLVGRLIPVIRQLISIPAGLSKMNIGVFSFYTFLGAGIWNCILALLGFLAVKAGGMDFIYKYSGMLSKVIIVIFVAACVVLIVRAIIKKKRR